MRARSTIPMAVTLGAIAAIILAALCMQFRQVPRSDPPGSTTVVVHEAGWRKW